MPVSFYHENCSFLRGCTLKSHWLELGPMATHNCRGVWEMNIFNQAHYTGQNWDSLLKEKGDNRSHGLLAMSVTSTKKIACIIFNMFLHFHVSNAQLLRTCEC